MNLFYESSTRTLALRACGEAPVRHDVTACRRLLGRQGRVAEGAQRRPSRPTTRMSARCVHRRAPARRSRDECERGQRRRREAPASDAARLDLYAMEEQVASRECTSRSSATSSLARRALPRPGARPRRRALDADRASDASAALDRESRVRGLAQHRGHRRRRRVCAPPAAGANGTREAFVARWSAALYGITPERVRPAGRDASRPDGSRRRDRRRAADSDAALVADQVRAGLVVRMAVLYDLLTVTPVPAPVTAEVA